VKSEILVLLFNFNPEGKFQSRIGMGLVGANSSAL
jgi:hypothetical protein